MEWAHNPGGWGVGLGGSSARLTSSSTLSVAVMAGVMLESSVALTSKIVGIRVSDSPRITRHTVAQIVRRRSHWSHGVCRRHLVTPGFNSRSTGLNLNYTHTEASLAWASRVEEAVLQESYSDSIPEMPGARLATETAFAAAFNREKHWLTHRLLWAMPWPASVVPADASAARAIGKIFDQTVSRHASRPLADTWIAWASKWARSFGACYRYAEQLRACVDEGDAPEGVVSLQSSPSHSSSPVSANAARAVDSSSPLADPFLPSSQSSEA